MKLRTIHALFTHNSDHFREGSPCNTQAINMQNFVYFIINILKSRFFYVPLHAKIVKNRLKHKINFVNSKKALPL